MAYSTIEEIVEAAILDVFKLQDDSIPAAYIKAAVAFYNASEPIVWRAFPWQTKKIEAEVSPDSDGIITLGSEVDIVRAVQPIESDGEPGALVWHEDEIRSAMNGSGTISTERFDHMADDDDGYRRIKVNPDDEISTYKILAFSRFEKARVEADYDSDNPTLTPADYRVLTWKLDQAEAALISFITDKLRGWNNQEENGKWMHSLNGAVKDLKDQQATEQLVSPDDGDFGEMGNWC